MFGLTNTELLLVGAAGLVALLAEVALLWVTSALVDADPGLPRLAGAGVVGFLLFAGVAFALFIANSVVGTTLGINYLPAATAAVVAGLVTASIITGILYSLVLSISFGKGQWAGVVQLLLRAFLYTLIAGVVAVVVAVVQIRRGPSPGAEVPVAVKHA